MITGPAQRFRSETPSPDRHPARLAGFTLVELLVALAVTLIILAILASVTSSSLNFNRHLHDQLSAKQDGKVALDFFKRDFDALTPAERTRTTLSIVQETVPGPHGSNLSSFWIMLLSRPVNSSLQGEIRAVSYRLLYKDPIVPDGPNKRLVIYRTQLAKTVAGDTKAFLDLPDLHAGFWKDYWETYSADGAGRTLLDDYLVEGIVDIKVVLNFRTKDGEPSSQTLPDGAVVNWTSLGFEGSSLTTPNIPVSITLILTSLRPEGARLFESGSLPLARAIERHGMVSSRTFPISRPR